MGNVLRKISMCVTRDDGVRRRKDMSLVISDPIDDLGHSFCYVRPDPARLSSSKVHSEDTTTTCSFISTDGPLFILSDSSATCPVCCQQ
ncbi:hypothetical protein CsSME_00029553 [Camellia sinensis var. sinensis]